MRIYDEENLPFDDGDDEMAGYSLVEDHSIFKLFVPEEEPETIASPIPENEQTVILADPHTAGLRDGADLLLQFGAEDACSVYAGDKQVGCLKAAYVKKLKAERGGQSARALYKLTTPPMIRLVFGDGQPIPTPENE